jgi:hypothetical protein
MSATTDTPDPDVVMIEKAIETLGEHFDTVQIFCTRSEGQAEGTTFVTRGTGNWFARYGSIRLWMEREENDEFFCRGPEEKES